MRALLILSVLLFSNAAGLVVHGQPLTNPAAGGVFVELRSAKLMSALSEGVLEIEPIKFSVRYGDKATGEWVGRKGDVQDIFEYTLLYDSKGLRLDGAFRSWKEKEPKTHKGRILIKIHEWQNNRVWSFFNGVTFSDNTLRRDWPTESIAIHLLNVP